MTEEEMHAERLTVGGPRNDNARRVSGHPGAIALPSQVLPERLTAS